MDSREDEHIIVDFDEALQKTGAELFKELYRIYPTADVEDYSKGGVWQNDLIKKDLQLIEAHRREAGAPDVDDLETITLPQLPANLSAPAKMPMTTSSSAKLLSNNAPVAAAGTASASTGLAITGASGVTAVNEVRLTALFAAKHTLDPVKCKTVFNRLNSEQKRHVFSKFNPGVDSAGRKIIGIEAMRKLVAFVQTCAKEENWDIDFGAASSTSNAADTKEADTSAAKASALLFPSSASKTATALLNATPSAEGGAKAAMRTEATPGMLTSTLINVPKLRPVVSAVKTAITAAELKRPLVPPATGITGLGVNWNSKRPKYGVPGHEPKASFVAKAFSPATAFPATRPPAARPQGGLLGNLLSTL